MKKPTKRKKLAIGRETVTSGELAPVEGGNAPVRPFTTDSKNECCA